MKSWRADIFKKKKEKKKDVKKAEEWNNVATAALFIFLCSNQSKWSRDGAD